MMIETPNPEWDTILERRGENALLMLLVTSNATGAGENSALIGLPTDIPRGYVEVWLKRKASERDALAEARASTNLSWTKIAAYAAIGAVVIELLTWLFPR